MRSRNILPLFVVTWLACSVQPEWNTHGGTAPHKAIRSQGMVTFLLVPVEVAKDDQALLKIADYYAKASQAVMLHVWTDRSRIPASIASMTDEQVRYRWAVVTVNYRTGHRSVNRSH